MKNKAEISLTDGYTHPVRDVLWGHVYMTEKQARLTESAPFMRLNGIMQLGPVYLVYPGATHTRASHSIGVYHLGRRLLQNLAERGAEKWLTKEGVNSFLSACLLHDLGHFPYTHSLKELSLSSHESLTGEIIMKEPMKSLVGAAGADPALTAAIIDKEKKGIHSDELHFYRKLLSGALDPDKLDYLNRDARYCGVPYGAQDVDFILSRLHPDKKRGVDIDSRLIPNVESILFSKYLMYRTVYWHRQVRAVTAMLKKSLINGLKSGQITGKDLYNLDDSGLFTLLEQKIKNSRGCSINGAALVESVREGKIYATAAEISSEKVNLQAIKSIEDRAKFEENFAEELRRAKFEIKGEDIIIDIPEPVSFETGLFVADEKRSFSESSSAFKPQTVNAFIQTLYTIRVFINQKYKEKIKTFTKAYSILNKLLSYGG
jgi:HD superfamily phosphohydrolase